MSKRLFPMFLVFFTLLGTSSDVIRRDEDRPTAVKLTNDGRKWVEETLKSFTLEEKVGQMLQVRYYLDYKSFDSPEYELIREELRNYHIGSAVCGMHFGNSGPIRSSA